MFCQYKHARLLGQWLEQCMHVICKFHLICCVQICESQYTAAHNFKSWDREESHRNKISLSSSFLNSQRSEAVLDLPIITKHFNGYSYICNDIPISLCREDVDPFFFYTLLIHWSCVGLQHIYIDYCLSTPYQQNTNWFIYILQFVRKFWCVTPNPLQIQVQPWFCYEHWGQ